MQPRLPDKRITVLAETNFRAQHRRFGIKRADRRAHMYVIGKTGTGKSTLIANLARQDASNGEGFALLDPHGDLVDQVLRSVPEERKTDMIYFNVPDTAHLLAFNPLEASHAGFRPLVASGLISVFKKIWAEFWGPRMEYVLRNTLLALLELPGSTLLDVPRMLDDETFRRHVLGIVQNAQVRRFWLREYQAYPARFRAEAIAPIQNKVGEFLVNPILRRIVGQPKSAFDLRRVMEDTAVDPETKATSTIRLEIRAEPRAPTASLVLEAEPPRPDWKVYLLDAGERELASMPLAAKETPIGFKLPAGSYTLRLRRGPDALASFAIEIRAASLETQETAAR